MDKEKKKFPIGPEHYTLLEEIGEGVSALVYRALCILNNEIVAIKILDFERCNSDLKNISRESHTMFLVDHANVLKSHCSFVNDHNLWVVMPYMAGGSCLHILKAAHPDGFEEVVIATILREVLKGLEYLHSHGHIHRDVKAGNILIGSRGAVKLGDLGVSTCLFDSGDRQRTRNTFVGTPCWMAPEVMEQHNGYDFKADIWSFGITALELAHGHAPFSKYPPMKVLLMTIQYAPPTLNYERDKKFSKSFKQMIASCLVKDPAKRPTVKKLIKHAFFKQARSNEYITRTLLDGLPSLGDRIKALKSEYKRGISTWNFNLEDMKAQAALEDSESSNNQTSKTNCQNSDDDLGIASLENAKVASQCNSPRPTENIERNMGESSNNLGEVSSNEGMRKMVIIPTPTMALPSPRRERLANHSNCLFSLLQSILQANATQRENLFGMVKQISSTLVNENCNGNGGCTHASIVAIEKSLLEISQNKEKELHQEITMLQLRIDRIEEELQKSKTNS
uniref:Protein kinase domain-containing protein n=1 Tax=Chenopodium quinoa TaxID=63459 RepID=A0A803N4Z8_CHEQI